MDGKRCTFVLGPYRSGTSMVARLLMALGADPGPEDELYPATAWNPSGYIQRPDVTRFNSSLIEQAGGSLFAPGDPADICRSVTDADFARIDLRWMAQRTDVVIKDPRFCFTLLGWIKAGVIRETEFRIVRTTRQLAPNVESALLHYDVQHYCGPTRETAGQMLEAYDHAAQWQCEVSSLDCTALSYEAILSRPDETVSQLARFVKCDDAQRIAAALHSLGSGKSRYTELP